jgi:hypothetical protein
MDHLFQRAGFAHIAFFKPRRLFPSPQILIVRKIQDMQGIIVKCGMIIIECLFGASNGTNIMSTNS